MPPHLDLGFGLGLRKPHYQHVIEHRPAVDWFEIISENFMVAGGRPLHILDQVRSLYPIAMHGVSLSIGSADPLDRSYLRELARLAQRVEPAWISDHLCWTGIGSHNLHDLLPLPYTEEALEHVVSRVQQVQDFLGRRLLLENVSSYLTFRHSAMPEWEFLSAVAARADCLLLLDVNNVFVSAFNHGYDPRTFIDAVPPSRVRQFHLAGHTDHGTYRLDTHDQDIIEPVWELYAHALQRFGPVATLIERDDNIPPFAELEAELRRARQIGEANHALFPAPGGAATASLAADHRA